MVRIIDNYTLFQVVGEGSYGKVYRAINKVDKKEYAVKVVEAKKFYADKKLEQYTVNEINILSNMQQSAHIIGYYDMLKSQTNFYFVYEFCNGGTLQTLLNKQKKLPQEEALKIFRQLLIAFKLLYKYNVMHRDLKPDNILFKDGVAKVGDFGFCKSVEKTKMTKTMLGSPIYMAPEILKGEVYSSKADIWSLGVVLFQMLFGYCPFESSSIPKLLKVLEACDVSFPETIPVSEETKDLIRKILTKNPKTRIEWKELFEVNISEQGKIIPPKNALSFLAKQRKSSWDIRKPEISSMTHSVSNRSLSKGNEITPRMKRQQTQVNLKPKLNENKTTNAGEKKLLPIQQDTDDESHKNKLVRKQKVFAKVKTTTNQETENHFKNNENLRTYLKRVTSGVQPNSLFNSKQKVVSRHSEIIQGNSIARNLQCVNQKHKHLFSILIYKTVVTRLTALKSQLLDQNQYPDIVNLIEGEIEDLNRQIASQMSECEQYSEMLDEPDYLTPMKQVLRERIPECKHLRLCYEMTMYLLNESVCGGLNSEEMSRIISLKLM